MIRFETASGSLYELDEQAGTWRRVRPGLHADPDAPLRSESDPMTGHSAVQSGQSVRIWGPSLTADLDFREIETTPVAKTLEPEGGAPAWVQTPPIKV